MADIPDGQPTQHALHDFTDAELVGMIMRQLAPQPIAVALGREVDRRLKSLHMRMAILSDVSKLLEEHP